MNRNTVLGLVAILVVVILVGAALALLYLQKSPNNDGSTTASTTNPSPAPPSPAPQDQSGGGDIVADSSLLGGESTPDASGSTTGSDASGTPLVTLYEHCGYTGNKLSLKAGKFNSRTLKDAKLTGKVSAIKINQKGASVQLFPEDLQKGLSHVITSDVSCLSNVGFNDSTASVKVEKIVDNTRLAAYQKEFVAELYTVCPKPASNSGYAIRLRPGKYNFASTANGLGSMKSIQVSKGFKATFYYGDQFTKEAMFILGPGSSCITPNTYRSLVIEPVNGISNPSPSRPAPLHPSTGTPPAAPFLTA